MERKEVPLLRVKMGLIDSDNPKNNENFQHLFEPWNEDEIEERIHPGHLVKYLDNLLAQGYLATVSGDQHVISFSRWISVEAMRHV